MWEWEKKQNNDSWNKISFEWRMCKVSRKYEIMRVQFECNSIPFRRRQFRQRFAD